MGLASLWPGGVSHLPPCQAPQCAKRARQAPVAGRTPRQSSSRTELPVRQSVPLLALLVGPLCSLSLCPSAFHVSRSQALLARYPLGPEPRRSPPYPRVSADREYFSTLHGAGVDEHDFARWGFPEAKALVDEPLINQHLYCL